MISLSSAFTRKKPIFPQHRALNKLLFCITVTLLSQSRSMINSQNSKTWKSMPFLIKTQQKTFKPFATTCLKAPWAKWLWMGPLLIQSSSTWRKTVRISMTMRWTVPVKRLPKNVDSLFLQRKDIIISRKAKSMILFKIEKNDCF